MGSKWNWFTVVKRVLTPQCCQGEHGKSLAKLQPLDSLPSEEVETTTLDDSQLLPPAPTEEVKLAVKKDEQNKHAYSVALASAVAAEAAAVAARAVAEVVRLASSTTALFGKSREEIAAIKIQTAFRGYLARRALRALRGLVKLKRLVDKSAVRSQTMNTLHCMQTMARIQTHSHSMRNRMKEENQGLQRRLQRKCEKEIDRVKIGEEWNDSPKWKEQTKADILKQKEAAARRERALAYAFSHQWNSSSRSLTPTLADPINPQLGWNWLARWIAARPCEKHSMMGIKDHAPIKSTSCVGQTMKHHDAATLERSCLSATRKSSRPRSQSAATPRSKSPSITSRRLGGGQGSADGELKSIVSSRSKRERRHSIAGLSVRFDESLESSAAVPSYMAPTESARARSRLQSAQSYRDEMPEKGSIFSAKKQHPSLPVADKKTVSSHARIRRHSGPLFLP